MRRLNAGCVTQRADAAREKLPASINAPKSSSHAISIALAPSATWPLVMAQGPMPTPSDRHGLIHIAHWSRGRPVGKLTLSWHRPMPTGLFQGGGDGFRHFAARTAELPRNRAGCHAGSGDHHACVGGRRGGTGHCAATLAGPARHAVRVAHLFGIADQPRWTAA